MNNEEKDTSEFEAQNETDISDNDIILDEDVIDEGALTNPERLKELYDVDNIDVDVYDWKPKTKLGRMVRDSFIGKLDEKYMITTMDAAIATGLPIREPEIVDILLPNLEDEVLDVNMVQRMTDSGRRMKFSIIVVVGNSDGYVGLGHAKGREVGPTIRKAIDVAKLNIIPIKRGCGSWECGCGRPHTVPFSVKGRSASVTVELKPAPRGIGLACGDVAKSIIKLAGVEDVWSFTNGKTRTTINFADAVFDALKKTVTTRITPTMEKELKIKSGPVKGVM